MEIREETFKILWSNDLSNWLTQFVDIEACEERDEDFTSVSICGMQNGHAKEFCVSIKEIDKRSRYYFNLMKERGYVEDYNLCGVLNVLAEMGHFEEGQYLLRMHW